MAKQFVIEIFRSETLSAEDIWPDGAPENPTAEDVLEVFLDGVSAHRTAEAWGLEIRKDDVSVTAFEPAELQRLVDGQPGA